jgi:hypothetical protein
MRILVISYYYAPSNSPRAIRWSAICEHWAGEGMSIDVVCCRETPNSPGVAIEDGVTVVRVADPASAFSRSLGISSRQKSEWRKDPMSRLRALPRSLTRRTLRFLRWPDHACLWIVPAYRAANMLLRSQKYDGMISVALPFSAHMVGWLVQRKMIGTPWVCDYGDPYSFQPDSPPFNYRLYGGASRCFERRVLRLSKRVAVTTAETAAEFVSRLGADYKWVTTIPPLLKPIEAFELKQVNRPIANSAIRLLFAGNLYKTIRNPRFALAVIARLRQLSIDRKITMDFYGGHEECSGEFEPYLGTANDWLFLHGPIDRRTLLEEYARSNILVNIGNATPYQLPSKVVEYIATGLPILNFASIERDSVGEFLRSHPQTLTVFEGPGISDKVVGDCLAFVRCATFVNRETVRKRLSAHAPDVIAGDYMKLLFRELD